MKWRIGVLKEHGLGLKEIQETIAKIAPLPGAKEFLDKLRKECQVIIISDTFTQFAGPLMEKLGQPTIFCNSLEVAADGEITGFKMRVENSKLTTVKALQSIGYDNRFKKTIRNFQHLNGMKICWLQLNRNCRSKQVFDSDCIQKTLLHDFLCSSVFAFTC